MIASLRFKGLDVLGGKSLLPSPPNLDSAWLIGPAPSGLNCILVDLSKLFRSAGLLLRLFSCPPPDPVEDGGSALPPSDAWLRTRFIGLLGEVRVREQGRAGVVFERVEDRSASFALGGKGTARGDGVCGGLLAPNTVGVDTARFGGEGDRGDFGEGLGDFVTRRNLEGERDKERLSDLTADVTSTW